jgi:hypothetical protein
MDIQPKSCTSGAAGHGCRHEVGLFEEFVTGKGERIKDQGAG